MPSTLLVRKQPAPVAPRTSVRSAVLEGLDNVDSYPLLSDTTVRVTALVNSADASVSEVAGIIRRDGVLTARVLRAANTWMYRGRKVCEDVQQAVLRLGLQECGKLLCTVGVKGLYERHPQAVRDRCDALLRHSLFVARLASGIGRVAGVPGLGAAFTAGLLHDMGRVVVAVKCPDEAAAADPLDYVEGEDMLQRERDTIGIDHCAIGYQFATRNNLPESVVRTALNHHRPEEENLQRELVSLIAVADRVANHAQREHKITGYELAKCPFFPVLSRMWTPDRRLAFRNALPKLVVQAIRDTRLLLKSCA